MTDHQLCAEQWDSWKHRAETAEARADKAEATCHEHELRASEIVSHAIDPSVGVSWMRCSPDLPKYIQELEHEFEREKATVWRLDELLKKHEKNRAFLDEQAGNWERRADKFEAACAETRVSFNRLLVLYEEAFDDAVSYRPDWIKHVLSADCGKGWLPPDKAKELATLLEFAVPDRMPDHLTLDWFARRKRILAAVKE